jgi:hypothetical protein
VSGPFLPLSSRRSVATSKDLTCVLNDFFLGSFLGVVVTHHTLQGLLRLGPQGSSGRKQKQHNARRSKVKQSKAEAVGVAGAPSHLTSGKKHKGKCAAHTPCVGAIGGIFVVATWDTATRSHGNHLPCWSLIL